jgi:hypothetical protein
MGHTLLHIACLPFDESQIQSSAPKISQSIHDVRILSPKVGRASRTAATYNESGEERFFEDRRAKLNPPAPEQCSRALEREHAEQEAMCKFIVATYSDSVQVSAADKHGNNMLHYLAFARQPNEALIAWARQREGGVGAWETERNFWGFTAWDLYEEGEAARSR